MNTTLIVLLGFLSCYSQHENNSKITDKINIDSLIKIEANPWVYDDISISNYVAKQYIKIGKTRFDTMLIAKGYYEFCFDDDEILALNYCDSLITLTENWKKDPYYTLPHLNKGKLLFYNEKAFEALSSFTIGYERAKEVNNVYRMIGFLNAIGSVKGSYGNEKDAILYHHKALYLTKKNRDELKSDYQEQMLSNYDNISASYLENGMIDSAFYYIDLAKSLLETFPYPDHLEGFEILEGQANFYDGNYMKSKIALYEIVNNWDGLAKADILYYIAKSEEALGEIAIRDSILVIIDSIMDVNPYPLDHTNDVYTMLLKNAIGKGDNESQLMLLDKLIYYDSIKKIKEAKVNSLKTDGEFNLKSLRKMRLDLKKELKWKGLFVEILGGTAVVLFFFLFFFIVKYQISQRKLKLRLREEIKLESHFEGQLIDDKLEPLMKELLDKLNEWENKLGFLDRTINQKSLSSQLGTNDTYLSKLVNTYKKQSFSNYLKDLRITHFINELKKNPDLIGKKSTIMIAEEYGFNSLDVFARSLKMKIGATPGQFFRQVKRGNL